MPPSSKAIISRQNPHLQQLRAAVAGRLRSAENLVALEGDTLVAEALRSGLHLASVFLAADHATPPGLSPATEIFRLPPDLLASVLATEAPQGIAALCSPPTHAFHNVLTAAATPLFLVAAALQDPGNLGTLVRSAEAFGATAVLTLPGTVSPWNGKALRASAGSVFRLPVLPCPPDWIDQLRARHIALLAAVGSAHPAAHSLDAVDLTRPSALLIGNEGAGLPPDLLSAADLCLTIPCSGPVESLNAAMAGSILLFAAQQQRRAAATAP